MSKEQAYADIARAYRYTPREIADMTPYQQVSLLSPEQVAETLYFDTMEEYLGWAQARR